MFLYSIMVFAVWEVFVGFRKIGYLNIRRMHLCNHSQAGIPNRIQTLHTSHHSRSNNRTPNIPSTNWNRDRSSRIFHGHQSKNFLPGSAYHLSTIPPDVAVLPFIFQRSPKGRRPLWTYDSGVVRLYACYILQGQGDVLITITWNWTTVFISFQLIPDSRSCPRRQWCSP